MITRGRGNKSARTQIQARRRRLAKLLAKGVSTGEAEIILQREGFRATDRVTLDRDLKQLHAKWAERNPEDFEKLRQVQLRMLERMEEFLLAERIDLDTAREWRAIRTDIAKLLGLNREVVPRVEVNVQTATEKMGLYARFLHETRWVPMAKLDLLWDFCRQIEEFPGAELKPTALPPADSELWQEDEPQAPALKVIEGNTA